MQVILILVSFSDRKSHGNSHDFLMRVCIMILSSERTFVSVTAVLGGCMILLEIIQFSQSKEKVPSGSNSVTAANSSLQTVFQWCRREIYKNW
jgi:hypothetical protein